MSKIQAIIIKGDKVLTVQGVNENGRRDNFFITGEVKEGETPETAVIRELKEQIDLEHEISLMFSKEVSTSIKTFLIDLKDKDIQLNCSVEKIKAANISFNPISLGWTPLSGGGFRDLETQYIKLLLEETYKSNYDAHWIEIIKNTYFHSKIGKVHLDNIYLRHDRRKLDEMAGKANKLTSILIALGLGLLFNYFFVWKSIGISGFIYTIAIIGGTIYGVKKEVCYKKHQGYIFLIPTLLLALSFSIFNNTVLTALNVMVIPFLIVAYLITIRYENVTTINLGFIRNILDRVFNKAFSTLPKFFTFSKEIIEDKVKTKGSTTTKNILKGLIIAIPLLVIILVLLSEADMMFNYYLRNIGNIFAGVSLSERIGRSIIITVVTLYMFSFLWSFRYNELKPSKEAKFKKFWEPVTIITLISVINIAYLIFTLIQFSYLYGGGLNTLPEGFSYAVYARRGFFELILVTLINFVVLLMSISFTKESSSRVNRIANISYSLLIIFTFNMLVSATYKMHLYEKAFGFTQLRIFVQAFMLLIGIILVIVLLGVWKSRTPVFKYAVIATLMIYVGLNYINVDRIIAKENILRYQETNNIDLRYLRTLSYDAAPEITKLLEVEDAWIREEVNLYINNKKASLKSQDYKWYQYNYNRSRLLRE